MIGPGWASNPDSPITVARQCVLRCYQQHHWGRYVWCTVIRQLFEHLLNRGTGYALEDDIISPERQNKLRWYAQDFKRDDSDCTKRGILHMVEGMSKGRAKKIWQKVVKTDWKTLQLDMEKSRKLIRGRQVGRPVPVVLLVVSRHVLPGYSNRQVWVWGPGWPDHCVRL